jgi:hypothetical protein
MPRQVTLVLVNRDGSPLGVLPSFPTDPPYWQEVGNIVAGARERFGVDVTVLRVLDGVGEEGAAVGGTVTYLAEASGVVAACRGPVPPLPDHPLRHPYAEPGGPARILAWARSVLDANGRAPVTEALQLRTWNLSTVWRLDTSADPYWLKEVPPFLAHESAVLRWIAGIAPDLVPPLLGMDGGRVLLGHVPGADRYDGGLAVRDAIDAAFHPIQLAAAEHVEELIVAGVPDARTPTLIAALAAVVARHGNGDPRLRDLVDGLPVRLAEVRWCGLPDTLVHGDLHPGNTRSLPGTDGPPVIVDWGDSFIGQPGFDILRLAERLEPSEVDSLLSAWASRWRDSRPGSDPLRAADLLRPVAALRNAAVYARFLDHIEPAEHTYHRLDVPHWLTVAADQATVDN